MSMTVQQIDAERERIIAEVGDIGGVDVFHSNILVGVYTRPNVTQGGIHLPDATREEDGYQSKVGIVLKTGPLAFVDDRSTTFGGAKINVGDWVVFRIGDGLRMNINKTPCRIIPDTHIRMRVADPTIVW